MPGKKSPHRNSRQKVCNVCLKAMPRADFRHLVPELKIGSVCKECWTLILKKEWK